MSNTPMVEVLNVTKSFAKQKVLNTIQMQVFNGEIFGLLGPSGAGKTTLVKILAGITSADSGSVSVLGIEMPNLSNLQRIGFMAQSDALYGELTALENLQFFSEIYQLPKKRINDRIDEVMKLVNLTNDAKKTVHHYSGGMKRRLSLAISLLHEPQLLILDEPTVGIDPVLRQSIWIELRRLSNTGTTIIVTTHVMDEAEQCNRLAMLRNGSIIAIGSSHELKQQTGTATLEQAFLRFGGEQV